MNQRFLEAIGIVLLAVVFAVAGKVWAIDFLTAGASTLFGIGVGYLGGAAVANKSITGSMGGQ